MGTNILLVVAVAVAAHLALICSVSGHGEMAAEIFHVAGKVVCQDCSKGWNDWINGTNPIKDCKVSVTCLDSRSRVVHYASDLTDESGGFEISCQQYVNGEKLNPQNCFLRLVSSPDPVCNIATDFAGGRSGVKLHRPTVVYRDVVKYVLGTFYYTTPMCEDPNTNNAPDEEESDRKQRNY